MTFGRILTFTTLIRKKMEIIHMTFNDIGAGFIKSSFEDLKVRMLIAYTQGQSFRYRRLAIYESGRD